MAYDRSAVESYASRYWNLPCDDGKIATAIGAKTVSGLRAQYRLGPEWDAIFRKRTGPNGETWDDLWFRKLDARGLYWLDGDDNWVETEITHDILEDCTHYVGRCLLQGGLSVPETDWAPTMVGNLQALEKSGKTKILGDHLEVGTAALVMATGMVKAGDVIAYWDVKKGMYSHLAVRVQEDGISCHTWSRYNNGPNRNTDTWNLPGKLRRYTFIHFTDDDPVATGSANTLAGWWMATAGGSGPWYYYFESNGKVTWTSSALSPSPSAPSRAPSDPKGRGYWFVRGNELLVIWVTSGSVEKYNWYWLTVGGAAEGSASRQPVHKGTWNSIMPISITRL